VAVLHSFSDIVTSLPDWNFDSNIVMPKTMVVVMPFFESDLKAALRSCRRHGRPFVDSRAARVAYHLMLAVRHLKSHGIIHRDLKVYTQLFYTLPCLSLPRPSPCITHAWLACVLGRGVYAYTTHTRAHTVTRTQTHTYAHSQSASVCTDSVRLCGCECTFYMESEECTDTPPCKT